MANEITIAKKMASAGTAACIADIMTFPFDVVKVRQQILSDTSSKRGLFGTLGQIWRVEGVRGLYGGIAPGLQRQCVYASIRIGIYDSIKDFYTAKLKLDGSTTSVMFARILSGITSGAIAISFAQPTDVVKVRMQAQGQTKVKLYTSSLNAYKTIYRTEGVHGLWKGLLPNMFRNSVVNATELVCYDTMKELILEHNLLQDGLQCHFTAAFLTGFCATFVASPIDVVKTRFMNSQANKYSGVVDCARCLFRESGILGFYKGFTPSFLRLGTWNIWMFVTYEQLKRFISMDRFQLKDKIERNQTQIVKFLPQNDMICLPAL